MCLHNLLHIHYMQAFLNTFIRLPMEYFKPVFTRKASLLHRNSHPKISVRHFANHPSSLNTLSFSQLFLALSVSWRHPHSKGRKIQGSSPSLLAPSLGSRFSPSRLHFKISSWSRAGGWFLSPAKLWSRTGKWWAAWDNNTFSQCSPAGQGWLTTASLTPAKQCFCWHGCYQFPEQNHGALSLFIVSFFSSVFNFIYCWSLCLYETQNDSEIPRDLRSRPDIRPFALKRIQNFEEITMRITGLHLIINPSKKQWLRCGSEVCSE